MLCRTQDGYALGEGVGEGNYEIAFEAHAGSQQATLAAGQVAYIATGGTAPGQRRDNRQFKNKIQLMNFCVD